MCQRELVESMSAMDAESIIGEECHIVAREENGPRGSSGLDSESRDDYDNLILLCSIHHKLVDDQPNTYSTEVLLALKEKHERWVRERLDARNHETSLPIICFRVKNAQSLVNELSGATAWKVDTDEAATDAERDLHARFAQHIHDFLETYDYFESGDLVSEQFDFGRQLAELTDAGFFVYCGTGVTEYGSTKLKLKTVFVFVFRKSSPNVVSKGTDIEQLFDPAFVEGQPTAFIAVKIN